MKRSELRRRMGMKYADLDLILEVLAREGRINQLPSSISKEMITLNGR